TCPRRCPSFRLAFISELQSRSAPGLAAVVGEGVLAGAGMPGDCTGAVVAAVVQRPSFTTTTPTSTTIPGITRTTTAITPGQTIQAIIPAPTLITDPTAAITRTAITALTVTFITMFRARIQTASQMAGKTAITE